MGKRKEGGGRKKRWGKREDVRDVGLEIDSPEEKFLGLQGWGEMEG